MDQPKSKKRFPYLLPIGVNAEIWEALERGTLDGLLTRSDMARIAMRQGLVSLGYLTPNYQQQENQQRVNGNGAQHVAPR